MRRIVFDGSALEDLQYWIKNEPKFARKIVELLEETIKSPFSGTGKPEPLKHDLKGFWSRRISQEHRLVYKVTDEFVIVASCRFHYS